MRFEQLSIAEVQLVTPRRFADARGYFMETFRENVFSEKLGDFAFVQENRSLSVEKGTVRGLHFQLEPRAQGKLVSCIAGAILDVAVDIRVGSPSFGRHVGAELTASNGCMLWIPPGFAHGFCVTSATCQLEYKCSNLYDPKSELVIAWNDPDIGIPWPVRAPRLSERDAKASTLHALGDRLPGYNR